MSILFLRQGGSPATPTEVTPSDDDADVSVTTRSDRDGATIRPPRVTLMTALDSLANSALADPQRGPLHAFEVKFERSGADEEGTLVRIYSYSNRAADLYAAKAFIIEYEEVEDTVDIPVADTTSGTDSDGAHLRVAQIHLRYALDSLRDADLNIASATDRDARRAYFHPALQIDEGWQVRLVFDQDGRGGDVYAISQIDIEYEDAGMEQIRAEEY